MLVQVPQTLSSNSQCAFMPAYVYHNHTTSKTPSSERAAAKHIPAGCTVASQLAVLLRNDRTMLVDSSRSAFATHRRLAGRGYTLIISAGRTGPGP